MEIKEDSLRKFYIERQKGFKAGRKIKKERGNQKGRLNLVGIQSTEIT